MNHDHYSCDEKIGISCCGCTGHKCSEVDYHFKTPKGGAWAYALTNKLKKEMEEKTSKICAKCGISKEKWNATPLTCPCKSPKLMTDIEHQWINQEPLNKEKELRATGQKRDITVAEYSRIHYWLRKNFGAADRCETEGCVNTTFRFEWALKPKMEYEMKRENFYRLCKSCHSKQDITLEMKQKLSKLKKGKKHPKWVTKLKWKPVVQCRLDGVPVNQFRSIEEASKKTGILSTNICSALRGYLKTAGKHKWIYANK